MSLDEKVISALSSIGIEAIPVDADEGLLEFGSILGDVVDQVTSGKGDERHGNGKGLLDQPWLKIAETCGEGFLSGQASKKLQEAMGMVGKPDYNGARFEREMLGVIAYTVFAIMFRRIKDAEDLNQ